jgi:hypothetical protein
VASAIAKKKRSPGNIRTGVILDPCGDNAEPRHGSSIDFLLFDPVAPLGVNASVYVPRGLPALAPFAVLLFHRPAVTKGLGSHRDRKDPVKMPRRPQKTGGLLRDAAAR